MGSERRSLDSDGALRLGLARHLGVATLWVVEAASTTRDQQDAEAR
jgi:hypothetical protein